MAVPVRRDNVAKNNARTPSFLGQVWQQITHFLEMPPTESPTLPEMLLARTGINSWVLASLSVGIIFYLLFLIIASLDGFAQAALNNSNNVWLSLLPPITLIYLLLVIPILRRRLNRSVEVFRSMVPLNDRFTRLENEAFSLNRRREWIAVGVGTLIGWVLLRPVWDPYRLSALLYDFIGDILIFGLTGWHIYAALSRTKLLVKMHGQVQNLNIFKDRAPFTPISHWTFTVTGVMIVGVVVMALLIPRENILHPSAVIVGGAIVLSTILVLVFSKVPTSMLSQFRVVRALIFFVIVAIIGTIGFSQFEENWTIIEAFYVTIITMTTIGYGDLVPTTEGGRIFTVVLSLFAIGIGGYAITSVASFVIEGNFHRFIQGRKVDKQIVQMSQHYILCGVGKVGKQIAIEFYKTQIPFVVIEQNSDVLEELLREIEIPYVQGDATQDASLRLAGIERAKGLVTTLRDDKDNVFVALSARSFKRDLRIISRVSHDKNRKKLEKAGATDIISPNAVSGRRMVSEMLHSEVVTFLDEMLRAEHQIGQTLRLEELHINEIRVPALVERLDQGELSITDIGQRTDLMVVAIKRQSNGDNPYIYTPRGNTRLQRNDVLIVIATPEQRVKLYHDVFADKNGWLSQLWN